MQKQIEEDIYSGRGIDRSKIDKDIDLQEEQERILGITPPDSKTKR